MHGARGVGAAVLAGLGTVLVIGTPAGEAGPTLAARPVESTTTSSSSSTSSTTTSTTSTSTSTTSTTTTTAPPPPPPPPAVSALCIGDSVMLGAGPPYQNTLSMCGVVDAVENRQMSAADDVALTYAGALPPTVVVGLGNNGWTDATEIDALVAALPGVTRIVLVTVQLAGGREWQGPVNAELRAAAERHRERVVIADWESASAGHPEWFARDGIHIAGNPTGALAYAAVVAAALQ